MNLGKKWFWGSLIMLSLAALHSLALLILCLNGLDLWATFAGLTGIGWALLGYQWLAYWLKTYGVQK